MDGGFPPIGLVVASIKPQLHRYIFLETGKNFLNSKVMVSFDSSRPNFAPYGFTCEVWTPVPMKRADRHNEIELNLLKSGVLHYLLGGRRVSIKAGQLAVFWAAIPHQIIDSERQTEYFVATMPLAWFLQCQFPAPFVHEVLHGRVLLEPRRIAAASDYDLFAQWVHDLSSATPERRRLVLLEMEARLLRFALAAGDYGKAGHPAKAPVQAAAAGFNRVEEMAAFIAQNYTRKLSTDEIAGSVGLHPNYAMGLFKKTFGISLVECVTQHRISHAQRLLATGHAKILEVALDSGFNSISRFNEAFKRAYNCSPRDYRKQHRLQ